MLMFTWFTSGISCSSNCTCTSPILSIHFIVHISIKCAFNQVYVAISSRLAYIILIHFNLPLLIFYILVIHTYPFCYVQLPINDVHSRVQMLLIKIQIAEQGYLYPLENYVFQNSYSRFSIIVICVYSSHGFFKALSLFLFFQVCLCLC